MKKRLRLIGFAIFGLALIAAVIKGGSSYIPVDELKSYTSVEKIKALFNKPAPQSTTPPQIAMPHLPSLMAQAENQELSLEEIQEIKNITARQLAAAKKDLASPDPSWRYAGAQQLSAYQTPESERMLIKTLSDKEPSVRRAAVESLSTFEVLSNSAINALLATIKDKNQTIQVSAINTLQLQINNEPVGSKRYQMIMQGLQQAEYFTNLSDEVRAGLHDFIEEQNSIPVPPQTSEIIE